jgi:hypothetical protein
MSATTTTAVAAVAANPRGRWRFSLGDLFRALTIACLAIFAAVQLGPLAAARDVGIALAIATALVAAGRRSRRLGIAAGLVAVAGLVPTIVAAGAPFSIRDAVCMECGQARYIHTVCGLTIEDRIEPTEASRWAAPLLAPHHVHVWTGTSRYEQTHWFGSATIGCGGPGEGAFMAWQLARLGDPTAGQRAYLEYLDILAGKSPKSMATHRQEVSDAVNAAVDRQR